MKLLSRNSNSSLEPDGAHSPKTEKERDISRRNFLCRGTGFLGAVIVGFPRLVKTVFGATLSGKEVSALAEAVSDPRSLTNITAILTCNTNCFNKYCASSHCTTGHTCNGSSPFDNQCECTFAGCDIDYDCHNGFCTGTFCKGHYDCGFEYCGGLQASDCENAWCLAVHCGDHYCYQGYGSLGECSPDTEFCCRRHDCGNEYHPATEC